MRAARGFRRTCRAVEVALGRVLRVVGLVVSYLLVGWLLGWAGVHALHLLRGDDR